MSEGRSRFRLLRYEAAIVASSFSRAFSSIRDRILLLVALIVIALMAGSGIADLQRGVAALPLGGLMLIAAGVALLVEVRVARRLSFLSAESAIAPDALIARQRVFYSAFWHVLVLAALAIPLLRLSPVAAFTIFLAYGAGIIVAVIGERLVPEAREGGPARSHGRRAPPPSGTRWSRMAHMAAVRQSVVGSSLTAGMAVAAAAGLCGFALTVIVAQPSSGVEPVIVAAVLAIVGLAAFSRIDHSLIRFAAFSGFGAGVTVAGHLPLMTVYAAVFGLLSLLLTGDEAALVTLFWAAAAIILSLRILHYRLRAKRSADFAVQIELVAAVALGVVLLPLSVVAIVVRILLLMRSSREATWSHP